MNKKIGVIGAGSWGTAIAILLSKKGFDVELYVRNNIQMEKMQFSRENVNYLPGVIIPSSVNITNKLSKIVFHNDIIVLAVPSHAVRDTLRKIKDIVKPNQVIVNLAKGLEEGTYLRISEIVKQEIPIAKYAVLSGPSHAEEVARDMPTTVVVSSQEKEIAQFVQDIFMSPKFRVYTNPDIVGVELGGSLKNVIALGAGISDGLGYGDNTKAALMNRGIIEITRLGIKMGAKESTFAGLSGIGDLIVTCTSMHSRNRRAGILIGKGYSVEDSIKKIGMVVEGIKTTNSAYMLSKKYKVKMPITEEIYRVLYEGSDVKTSVINLMLRDKKYEMEDIINDRNC